MVILGLGLRQMFSTRESSEYVESPPLTIVRPRANDEKQDRLDGKTDAVCEENDRVDCDAVNGALASTMQMVRTVSDPSEVWEYTARAAAARCRMRRVHWIVASEIEQVLKLRRTKVEAR